MAGTKTPELKLGLAKTMKAAVDGGMKFEVGTYAFDSEYATGGETFSLPGFNNVIAVIFQPKGGYVIDYVSAKAKVYVCDSSASAMTEVASSTDLSALSDVPYIAFGT